MYICLLVNIHDFIIMQHIVTSKAAIHRSSFTCNPNWTLPSCGAFKLIPHEASKGKGMETNVRKRVAKNRLWHRAQGLEESTDKHEHSQNTSTRSDTSKEVGNHRGATLRPSN